MKPTCGAKTRSGGPCRHEAGWGTDHPGAGRCKLHGGSTPIKHGIYSRVLRPRHQALLAELSEAPVDDPSDDIRVHQVLVLAALEQWQEQLGLAEVARADVEAALEAHDPDGIGRAIEQQDRAEKLADYLWGRVELALDRQAKLKQKQQDTEASVPLVDLVDYVNRVVAVILPYVQEPDRERLRTAILAVPFSRH